jgi:hypothetical protein
MLLALGVANGCSSVDVRQCGDGELVDHGWNAYYPRFEIWLPTLERDIGEVRTFRICEGPDSHLALRLVVVTDDSRSMSQEDWRKIWTDLEASGTSIEVGLTDGEGVTLAEFAAPLVQGWKPATSGHSQGGVLRFFRASELSNLRIESGRSYELRITTRGEVPEAIKFRPMLVGGGKDSS